MIGSRQNGREWSTLMCYVLSLIQFFSGTKTYQYFNLMFISVLFFKCVKVKHWTKSIICYVLSFSSVSTKRCLSVLSSLCLQILWHGRNLCRSSWLQLSRNFWINYLHLYAYNILGSWAEVAISTSVDWPKVSMFVHFRCCPFLILDIDTVSCQ